MAHLNDKASYFVYNVSYFVLLMSLYGHNQELLTVITSGQIRMARAFLRWSIEDLANKSGVGASTIKRMETFDGVPSARVENLQAIKDTFIATKKIKFESENSISVKE